MNKTNKSKNLTPGKTASNPVGMSDRKQEPLPGREPTKAFLKALDSVEKMGRKRAD